MKKKNVWSACLSTNCINIKTMIFVCCGIGSYGIVLSPCLGIEPNTYIHPNSNYVSKILYTDITLDNGTIIYAPADMCTYEHEINSLERLTSCYPFIFTSKHFVLPIDSGILDVNSLEPNITIGSPSPFPLDHYNATRCSSMLNQMLNTQLPIYHIVFPKGSPINLSVSKFYSGIKNVFNCLRTCTSSFIFLDDVTYNNLVLVNSMIKIIDYANPLILNANDDPQAVRRALSNVKFKNTHYYLYNPILVQLAYSLSNNIDIVIDNYGILMSSAELCTLGLGEIYDMTQENDADNVDYKNKLLERLFDIIKYCIPTYKICLKLKKFNKDMGYFESDEEVIELDLEMLKRAVGMVDDDVDKIFRYVKLYLDGTDLDYKLRWLFTHTNMHSFAVVLIQWLELNKMAFHDSNNWTYLKSMIDVIFGCMGCVIFKDDDVFINGCDWKNIVM